jgi:hypothetical protein
MIGVINFYEWASKNYRVTYPSGLICRAPIPFRLGTTADRLILTNLDPTNTKGGEFLFTPTNLTNYNPREDTPLRHLGLTSDEFLLSIGYKYRHCTIISEPICSTSIKSPGEPGFIVTPLYTIKKDDGDYKDDIDYEMVLRAQAYQIDNVFYLPGSTEYGLQESFARIDRMCFINKALLQPKPITLSARALDLLREWTWRCFGFPLEGLDPALDKFIEEASKTIDERLRIK